MNVIQPAYTDRQLTEFVIDFSQTLDLNETSNNLDITFAEAVAMKEDPRFREKFAMVAVDALKTGLLSPQTLLSEVCAIAFQDVTNVFEYRDGIPMVKDFSQMDALSKKTIKSMKVQSGRLGSRIVEVQFYDKMDALKTLIRLFIPPARQPSESGNGKDGENIDSWVVRQNDSEEFSV